MTTSEEVCCEDMDNILLAHRSLRLELEAIENAARKTVKAYRSKEFDKLLAVADPANDADFVKEVSFYIIRLILIIDFVILYILYFILFLGNGHWNSSPKP